LAPKPPAIANIVSWATAQRWKGRALAAKPKGKKSAAAALAVKAIWLDVDVGKEGAYRRW
jgi:hypothetical protein